MNENSEIVAQREGGRLREGREGRDGKKGEGRKEGKGMRARVRENERMNREIRRTCTDRL